jgi:hypothetical protein
MATNNYMPMGRTPRSGGAGVNTYKKGGTTKVAGIMKKGGAKYQSKGTVATGAKNAMVKGAMAINAAAKEAKLEGSRPKMVKRIAKIKR